MTFDKILEDKRLWAVKYDGEDSNCFDMLFSTWYDMSWLRSFFQENLADLSSFFHITDVYEAVMDTIVHSYDIDPHSYDVDPLEEGMAFKEQSLFACKQAIVQLYKDITFSFS